MGYTIKIGNAKPWHENDDEGIRAGWAVEFMRLENAPAFGDPTDYENQRWPSYTAWADMARDLDLYDFFFEKWDGLFSDHPGIVKLKATHLEKIKHAVEYRRANNGGRKAAFVESENVDLVKAGVDPSLARGEWLLFWVDWAIKNCEVPAIQNS